MQIERRFLLSAAFVVLMIAGGCSSTPAYVGLTAEELFTYSERAIEQEEWSDAVGALQRLLSAYPAFGRIPEARLHLAHAFTERGEHLSASSEYMRVIERFPGHERAPEAALGVCRSYSELSPNIQRDQAYTRQAVTHCQRAVRDYPRAPEAAEAEEIRAAMTGKLAQKTLMNGEYYFRNKFYDSALIYFEEVVESYPETPAAPRALLMTMRAYEAIGWEDEAQAARNRLIRLYPDSPAAGEVDGAV